MTQLVDGIEFLDMQKRFGFVSQKLGEFTQAVERQVGAHDPTRIGDEFVIDAVLDLHRQTVAFGSGVAEQLLVTRVGGQFVDGVLEDIGAVDESHVKQFFALGGFIGRDFAHEFGQCGLIVAFNGRDECVCEFDTGMVRESAE